MNRPPAVSRAAAYHEAGHAVASWRLGDGIGGVTIAPGIDPETGAAIEGAMILARGDRSAASGWGHRHLVVVLAGAAAQRALDARSCVLSCAASDLRSARAFAAVMCRSREAERALLTWAQAEARAIVSADWHLVEVLAAALLTATMIAGEVAIAILVEAEARARTRWRSSHSSPRLPRAIASMQAGLP